MNGWSHGQPNPRLVTLLRGSIAIVRQRGLDYAAEVAHYLGEMNVTGPEAAWLGPRLMAYAQGMLWGFDAGVRINERMYAFTIDPDILSLRRN